MFFTLYSSPSGYFPANVGYSAKCGVLSCGLLTQRVSWAPSTVRRLSYGRGGGGPSADVSSSSEAACVPVKTYINADLQKLQVLKENKAKSGIYRWVNLKNGKSYVGSSVNLRRRLINYYSILNLKAEIKRNKSIIYRSLLRYKHYNFSLEILEYCEPSATISREQYYLDMLKPAYNILKTAASSLGFF